MIVSAAFFFGFVVKKRFGVPENLGVCFNPVSAFK
jgi:hypothetical protein